MSLFQTSRLSVRLLRAEDFEPFHEMQSNPEVMRYTTGRPLSKEENRQELARLIQRYAEPGNDFWVWAVIRKEDGAFAGTCALICNEQGEREIGYRFLQKYWGQGYGLEITQGLIDYAFGPGGVECLVAYVYKDNAASVSILERSRFRLVKEFFNEAENCLDRRYEVRKE
jgi:[ribosomal protein S5]-alanine N-acetyltransferase